MLLNCGIGEDSRVPWTARRSNRSVLKWISPEYSLEGLMLKLKLQFFGHLMRRTDSLEKTLMLGKTEGRRRGWQRMRRLDGITDWWTWVWASSGSWWWTGKPGILQSMDRKEVARTGLRDWTELILTVRFCATMVRRAFSGSCLHSAQEGCRKACLLTPIRCHKSLLLCRPQAEWETALHEDTFRQGLVLFYSTSFMELQLRSGTRETRQTISLKRFKSHRGRKDTIVNSGNLQWVRREGSTWEAQEDIGLMGKLRQGSWCFILDLLTLKSLTKVQVSMYYDQWLDLYISKSRRHGEIKWSRSIVSDP